MVGCFCRELLVYKGGCMNKMLLRITVLSFILMGSVHAMNDQIRSIEANIANAQKDLDVSMGKMRELQLRKPQPIQEVKRLTETINQKSAHINNLRIEYGSLLIAAGLKDKAFALIALLNDVDYAQAKRDLLNKMGVTSKFWVYGRDTKVGFEILNSSSKPVWITLLSNGKPVFEKEGLMRAGWVLSGNLSASIDINAKNKLLIYSRIDKDVAPKVYEFTPGKTLYLTWDGQRLVAQKPGYLLPATLSGYSLQNNVRDSDIQRTDKKESAFIEALEAEVDAQQALEDLEGEMRQQQPTNNK